MLKAAWTITQGIPSIRLAPRVFAFHAVYLVSSGRVIDVIPYHKILLEDGMFHKPLLLVVGLAFCGICNITSAKEEGERVFDHHVHVLSPRLVADWKSLGMEFSRADEAYTDASLIMEQNDIGGAFLISMAHLYATDDFRTICTTGELESRLVAAENDYVAVSVARHPSKFVGFFSVNIFREYAFDELARCKANPNLTGLKLHLPACSFDFEKEEHWKRLSEVLAWAARENVPVLLHLTADEEVDLSKASWFWESVVGTLPSLELYMAHLGAAGGFNDSSENILMGYHFRKTESPAFAKMRIYFDLSGAKIGTNPEIARTDDERCRRLSELILKIGVDRFLFASDYPVFSVSETRNDLKQRLVLPADDMAVLLSNRSRRFTAKAISIKSGEPLDEDVP